MPVLPRWLQCCFVSERRQACSRATRRRLSLQQGANVHKGPFHNGNDVSPVTDIDPFETDGRTGL